MDGFFATLIVFIIMMIPISAILGATWVKALRIKNEAPNNDLMRQLAAASNQHAELLKRIETLETIVTGSDWDRRMALHTLPVEDAAQPQKEQVPTPISAIHTR